MQKYYVVDTVRKNAVKIKEYIKKQLKKYELGEHLVISAYLWAVK